jgi:hypothetical protein
VRITRQTSHWLRKSITNVSALLLRTNTHPTRRPNICSLSRHLETSCNFPFASKMNHLETLGEILAILLIFAIGFLLLAL